MKVNEITYVALFAAIMGVLGLVPPIMLSFTPVPITLQTFGVILAGGLLGARLGATSQILFLMIVAAGLPLLSGGRGGLSVFAGPSSGYLISYPITAFCIGYLLSRFRPLKLHHILLINLTVGILLIYAIGIPIQAFMMDIPVLAAVKLSLVYIPGDVIKAVFASLLINKIRKNLFFSRSLATNDIHHASKNS
ncbi:biotin transport system substrate-specific component [Fictibacillus solisalsi]|uniref:Biotin transporter n=1 Tax=Fictibacillus solisalsi TaxID=459525 RepID=A0A1G9VS09_9BACL|nr:biotin transporter BioY [Fictibacillus solisalsi]SDM74978.1 biotin transport system substrate-specific component [Fictibacillus solisalsi]